MYIYIYILCIYTLTLRDIYVYLSISIYLSIYLYSDTFAMPTGDTETVIARKSEGLPKESIKPPTTTGNSIAAKLKWILSSNITAVFIGNV